MANGGGAEVFWREFGRPHKMRSGAEKRNSAGGRQCYQIVRACIERCSDQLISEVCVL